MLNITVKSALVNGRVLDTHEAAEFLRVSEASIRRWADSGLLATRRVGRRRARRFREKDLLSFMGTAEDELPKRSPARDELMLQGMAVPFGSHLGSFYTSDEGRLRLALPFLRDGLRARQTCFLLAGREIQDQIFGKLREEKVDIDAAIRTRLLMLLAAEPATPEQRVNYFDHSFSAAARIRPSPMRFVGEVGDALVGLGSIAAQMAVEERFAALAKRYPVVVLCLYDARRFDGATIIDALKLHYDTFAYPLGYFLS
jgi:transcriptional repressor of dcmA and dcmR